MAAEQGSSKSRKPRRLGRGLSSLMQTEGSVGVEPPAEPPTPLAPPKNRSNADPSGRGEPGGEAGLDPEAAAAASGESSIASVPLDQVRASPFQPRREIEPEALASLAASIRQSGVIQPVLVRPVDGGGGDAGAEAADGAAVRYELVAGERRWRAALEAGLETIPAIVRALDDEAAAELALVENIQREDLNAIERARALRALVDRFGLTQSQVGERVGLNRSSVANLIRLGELEDEIQELIVQDRIGAGHGKALLAMPPGLRRIELARQAADYEWTVRRLEQAVDSVQRTGSVGGAAAAGPGNGSGAVPAHGPGAAEADERSASVADLERQLGEHLGTKVRIRTDRSGQRGRLVVEFYGLEHFDGLVEKMGFRAG